jgi:hypothetical protein
MLTFSPASDFREDDEGATSTAASDSLPELFKEDDGYDI